MSFFAFSYTADVLFSGVWTALEVKTGSVTLDEGWAPYCQADITVATPDTTALQDALDPRSNPRVRVIATDLGTGFVRTFTLWLRSREFNHVTNETRLELASGEARLQDLANATPSTDSTFRQVQSSVRAIVNQMLGRIGTALQAGTADADFTTLTSVTNLILNPSTETDTSNWLAAGNSTISRITGQGFSGNACVQMNLTAAGTGAVVPSTAAPGTISARGGQQYTFLFYVKSATASRTWQGRLRFYDSSNAAIGSDWNGSVISSTTAGWTRIWVTATAPANAAKVWPIIGLVSAGAANEKHYLDAAMLVEGDGKETDTVNMVTYHDGSTPDTALYNYDWTGTANASSSTRTPVYQRDPATLSWDPGEAAWSFLQPVLTQAGLRLFCDETGKWFLVDSGYLVDGLTIVAEAFNAVEATDTIARDSEEWADSVVVKYTWNDTTNTQQTRYDVASNGATAPKTLTVEYQRPYPGPGAAAYILQKLQGRGRVLGLTAISDLTTTPCKPLSATLPDTPVQTGVTSAIRWDFAADEMTIKSRGLLDTPPDSWLFMPEDLTWDGIATGVTWDTLTF